MLQRHQCQTLRDQILQPTEPCLEANAAMPETQAMYVTTDQQCKHMNLQCKLAIVRRLKEAIFKQNRTKQTQTNH